MFIQLQEIERKRVGQQMIRRSDNLIAAESKHTSLLRSVLSTEIRWHPESCFIDQRETANCVVTAQMNGKQELVIQRKFIEVGAKMIFHHLKDLPPPKSSFDIRCKSAVIDFQVVADGPLSSSRMRQDASIV